MEEEKDKLKSDHKVVDITNLDMHDRDPNHLNSHVSVCITCIIISTTS